MTTKPERLKALREELNRQQLDGFIIPLTDEHMSEYVGAYAHRLAWVTGFEGSAGNAAILLDKAALFVDGRYTLQAKDQIDPNLIEDHHFETYPLLDWVLDHAPEGARIGYDAELATVGWQQTATQKFAKKNINLISVETNPVDQVWNDQPSAPLDMVIPHADKYAGQSAADKRSEIASHLREKGADAAIITMLDSVAWAFNIRGSDVDNTPVPHAFAVLKNNESAVLFVNDQKVDENLRVHLGNSVEIKPRDAFYQYLSEFGAAGKTALVDPMSNNAKVFEALESAGARLIESADPCIIRKAVKNTTEQQGSRDAHVRDGAAICDFLHWLSVEGPKGNVDELKAIDHLWNCRSRFSDLLRSSSFDTISGSGPNGAIVHYRASEATNRKLEIDNIFLIDSGGQYLDGTTDITRTVIIGTPTNEMKDRFTRVLKGHIALSTTKFAHGTSGHALDSIARHPLWQVGLDYDHGTGHGVGSFLAVHEGPQRIAKFGSPVPLEPGMILSNEPGYYKAGEYGIRIENLVLVRQVDEETEYTMHEFENLTWAPIDRNLIDTTIMTAPEREWLNTYHQKTYDKLKDIVLPETLEWLKYATAPI
ncbi:aminopeptidase P family protein [Kordiimonas sp. SCSIO 12610]|uniref:aminopeptidase P family protein n=1 Tax=Kordiimonas sp. SCSIO 12610 TaxID=2829597 RepID=UPI00210B4615|nr:aminopeptidase P family protein [Kordiimonas sp. SCSIO 12610]UTW55258.1 aminopeptidase P family protein [Kordiimonas sp. SCSIO 12610]